MITILAQSVQLTAACVFRSFEPLLYLIEADTGIVRSRASRHAEGLYKLHIETSTEAGTGSALGLWWRVVPCWRARSQAGVRG